MNWEGSGFRRCHSGRKGGVWIYGGHLLCWSVTLQSSDLAYKAEGQGQEAGSLFFAALGFCGPTSCTGYTVSWRGAEPGAVVLSPSTIYQRLAVPRYWPATELSVRSPKGRVAMSGLSPSQNGGGVVHTHFDIFLLLPSLLF